MRKPTTALHALLASALLLLLSTTAVTATAAGAEAEAEAEAPTPVGACTDGSGVTVVVDLTDLEGELEVGCAAGDPATGRAALTAAGFTATDESSGMICAINAAPDPCPETFAGSYWSYWSAEPSGTWIAQEVGADASDPAPGGFEGWRYNDGASGPGVLPAALGGSDPSPNPSPTPTTVTGTSIGVGAGSSALYLIGVLMVGAALLIGALVAARRRRATSTSSD